MECKKLEAARMVNKHYMSKPSKLDRRYTHRSLCTMDLATEATTVIVSKLGKQNNDEIVKTVASEAISNKGINATKRG